MQGFFQIDPAEIFVRLSLKSLIKYLSIQQFVQGNCNFDETFDENYEVDSTDRCQQYAQFDKANYWVCQGSNCEVWKKVAQKTCDVVIGLPTPIYDQEYCGKPSK